MHPHPGRPGPQARAPRAVQAASGFDPPCPPLCFGEGLCARPAGPAAPLTLRAPGPLLLRSPGEALARGARGAATGAGGTGGVGAGRLGAEGRAFLAPERFLARGDETWSETLKMASCSFLLKSNVTHPNNEIGEMDKKKNKTSRNTSSEPSTLIDGTTVCILSTQFREVLTENTVLYLFLCVSERRSFLSILLHGHSMELRSSGGFLL